MPDIIDLDILKPPSRMVKLKAREIDVSFIPCAITFDIEEIRLELVELVKDIEAKTGKKGAAALESATDGPNDKRVLELGVKMCVAFCAVKFPDMDVDWFMTNTSPAQVAAMSQEIQLALTQSLKGVVDHQKKTVKTAK